MAVINNPIMEKYKTYFTEKVKGKDGVVRPITKVKYIKVCPICGGEMNLMNYKPGGNYKPFIAKWWCSSRICGHSETEPTQHETVKLNLEMENLKYGECIHHENLAACSICNPELL
jgi:hypothetical protein